MGSVGVVPDRYPHLPFVKASGLLVSKTTIAQHFGGHGV